MSQILSFLFCFVFCGSIWQPFLGSTGKPQTVFLGPLPHIPLKQGSVSPKREGAVPLHSTLGLLPSFKEGFHLLKQTSRQTGQEEKLESQEVPQLPCVELRFVVRSSGQRWGLVMMFSTLHSSLELVNWGPNRWRVGSWDLNSYR